MSLCNLGGDIVRYTNYHGYVVREDGHIFNKDGTLRRINFNQKGYAQVSLKIGSVWTTRQLHKLLFELFVEKVPAGFEVDHIDNNRSNFYLSNLQLLSRRDNRIKSYRDGFRDVSGLKNPNAKLTQEQIDRIDTLIIKGFNKAQISRLYSVNPSCIQRYTSTKGGKIDGPTIPR